MDCCHVTLPFEKAYTNHFTDTQQPLINQRYECMCVNAMLLVYVGGKQGRRERGVGADRGDVRLGVLILNGRTVSSLTKSH